MNKYDNLMKHNEREEFEILSKYTEQFDIVLNKKGTKEEIEKAEDIIVDKLGCLYDDIPEKFVRYCELKSKINKQKKQEEVKEQTEEEKFVNEFKEGLFDKFKEEISEDEFKDLYNDIKDFVDSFDSINYIDKFIKCSSEIFSSDTDISRALDKSIEFIIDGKTTVDDVVNIMLPIILDVMTKQGLKAIPKSLAKLLLEKEINERKSKLTSIIVVDNPVNQTTNENEEVIDVEAEEATEHITFDDNGLMEVEIIRLNSDGITCDVRPKSDMSITSTVDLLDLIEDKESKKIYVKSEILYQGNFRDEIMGRINQIAKNPQFELLMRNYDNQFGVDIEPGTDPNFAFDKVHLYNQYRNILVMLDFEGNYITDHSKVLVLFEGADQFVALPVTEGLFNELISKDVSEFKNKNILSDEVLALSQKLNLHDIPVSSFDTVLNNILKNKNLRKVILETPNTFFRFDGKVTSKKFTITDETTFYTYNNGKVTRSLIQQQ